jgi:hypothetical protein
MFQMILGAPCIVSLPHPGICYASTEVADGRWQMADGRWQMADGRWLTFWRFWWMCRMLKFLFPENSLRTAVSGNLNKGGCMQDTTEVCVGVGVGGWHTGALGRTSTERQVDPRNGQLFWEFQGAFRIFKILFPKNSEGRAASSNLKKGGSMQETRGGGP